MKISYELRNRIDKAGYSLLRIVVRDKGDRQFIPVHVKVKPSEWDQEKQQVKSNHPHAGTLNKALRLKIVELETGMLTGAKDVLKKEYPTFRAYATELLGRWESRKTESTLRAYRSKLKKVLEFDEGVRLDEITPTWLLKYEVASRKDGCQDAGVLKRMAFVSVVLGEAVKYSILDKTPFAVYDKPSKSNPERVWLNMDEIDRIEQMETQSETLQNTAIWFLLACLTGLRYSDVAKFDPKKHFTNGRIHLYTTKTTEVVSIRANDRVQRLIARLPEAEVYSNQKCNQYLKAIAHICKIDKSISFHTARHSFAIQCANLGMSQEVVSKLLGHSDLRTTAIYYKIINSRIDAEMEKWG